MIATVKYQIATYNGEIEVNCDPGDDNEYIISVAKASLRRKAGHFPFGYESWKVINRY